jgi:cyanophycinase
VVGLVGSGEVSSGVESIDRELLAATGGKRPRVAVLPTAMAPRGEAQFTRTCELGRQHFAALGAEVEAVALRNRADADDAALAQAIGEADVVWLSGGVPDHLHRVLTGTAAEAALWAAFDRGAVVAGCDAGAAVLGGHRFVLRRRPWPLRWLRGLGLVPGAALAPHYDTLPEPIMLISLLRAPSGEAVVGIDERTALVGRDGHWQVQGLGRVTVWRGRQRSRYRDGDAIQL